MGRDGFEQIESSDFQKFLESQDEDPIEADLRDYLTPNPMNRKQESALKRHFT